ncbi:MAG TPA: hypothetical protein VFY83_17415, partial [Anaerolineales bacterium]|nr:hypothetical protein [Anaerolineales bacterium]
MNNSKTLKRNLKRAGWGSLAIVWGGTILFDFIPFGAGLIGTGLILLGVNIVRAINHLQTKNDNTILGILALAWGGLELARPLLRQLFPPADLDWVIFAILLIGWGVILLTRVVLVSSSTVRPTRQ